MQEFSSAHGNTVVFRLRCRLEVCAHVFLFLAGLLDLGPLVNCIKL